MCQFYSDKYAVNIGFCRSCVCTQRIVFFFSNDFILAQTCLLNLKRICSLRYDLEHCIWIVCEFQTIGYFIWRGEDKFYIWNGNSLNAQNGIYKEEYLRLTYKLKKKVYRKVQRFYQHARVLYSANSGIYILNCFWEMWAFTRVKDKTKTQIRKLQKRYCIYSINGMVYKHLI